jgi:hypothetical protein
VPIQGRMAYMLLHWGAYLFKGVCHTLV